MVYSTLLFNNNAMTTPRSPLRDLLDAALTSLFDPDPIRFVVANESGVRPVSRLCQQDLLAPVPLRRPLTRNAFLRGCLAFTQDKSVEHVIVGFGRQHGNTTRVDAVAHQTGTVDRVNIDMGIWEVIRDWLGKTSQGEVLLVHNHPPNVLNRFFDNLPLASVTDRETWLRTLFQGGGVRFFLVENGFVRAIRAPALLRVFERFQDGQAPS